MFLVYSQCMEEGRDLEGRVQWQDLLQHILTQECWVQAPHKALNYSVPQLIQLYNGDDNYTSSRS